MNTAVQLIVTFAACAAYCWCCGAAWGRFANWVMDVGDSDGWSFHQRLAAFVVSFTPLVMSLWPGWRVRLLAWLTYAVAYVWIGPGRKLRKKLKKKIASSLTEVQAAMLQREVRANA